MWDTAFQQQVDRLSGQATGLCYHCHKCTGGCPVAYAMSYGPDRLLRLVQLGYEDEVLRSRDIWLCAGCETCGARCPNDISLARVMDALRMLARDRGVRPGEPHVPLFHNVFLRVVEATGQMHEATLLGAYKLLSRDVLSDLGAGWKLVVRRKVPLLPHISRSRARVRRVFALARKEGWHGR